MHNEVSQSVEIECNRRLTNLYYDSHVWLLQCANNITKNREESADLVQDLYVYLAKKCNPKIWWGESYNRMYLHAFLKHRWLNKTTKLNRYKYTPTPITSDKPDEEYDIQLDYDIMNSYEQVIRELKHLQQTKLWAPARIYEMYYMSEDNLNEVADKIGISKSTTFLSIKKIRKHLEKVIDNPFHK
jgi:DNA-directed RNA polymerase specialized sigma24 family protein